MCANCDTYEYCDCNGGASLAECSCLTGEWCAVCGHTADAPVEAEAPHLTEAALTLGFDARD